MYTKSATWEGAAWVTTRSSPARSGRWLEHSRSNALNVELRAGSPAASRRGEASTTHTRHVGSVHTVKPWPKPCLPHTDQNTPDHAHKSRTGAFISVHLHAPPLDVVVAHAACRPSEAILEALGGLSMQDPANELPRIPIPRTSVNKSSNAFLRAPKLACWHHTASGVSASNEGARTDEHLSHQDPPGHRRL
jgi:hypothetical protein